LRLEVADHEVDTLRDGEPSVAEHLVRLAHAGGRPEVDAQLSSRETSAVHGSSLEVTTAFTANLYVFFRSSWSYFTSGLDASRILAAWTLFTSVSSWCCSRLSV
jgi:hypothetical protein